MRTIRHRIAAVLLACATGSSLAPVSAQTSIAPVQPIFTGDHQCGDSATDCLFPLSGVSPFLHVIVHDSPGNDDWSVEAGPDCARPLTVIAGAQPINHSGFLEVVVDLADFEALAGQHLNCVLFRGRNRYYVTFYAAYTDDNPQPDADTVYPGYQGSLGRPVLADLDVAYIRRDPTYAYDARQNRPSQGVAITYRAHVFNVGQRVSGVFGYSWYLDGRVVLTGNMATGLFPGAEATATLSASWDPGPHVLTFRVFPTSEDLSVDNNELSIRTDALTVGLWVEQSAWTYFLDFQWTYCRILPCKGSDSFADWAQRQVDAWNSALASAEYNIAGSAGIADRVALDKITVVPDGSLPRHGGLASNDPDSSDHSVDLQWGITASGVRSNYHHMWDGPFDVDWGMIHELSHARSLADLYRFDIPIDPGSTIDVRDANGNPVYDPKSPFDPTRELHAFRGGQGNPFLFLDAERDLMSCTCDPHYSAYSAMVLNRIGGRRAVCGNENPPCNLGDWFLDLPPVNEIRLLGPSDRQLDDTTKVQTFFDSGSTYTGHRFTQSDSNSYPVTHGMIRLSPDPFRDQGRLRLAGHNLLLLEVETRVRTEFCFIEPTLFNEADWLGYSDAQHPAIYTFHLGDARENNCGLALPPPRTDEPFATSARASWARHAASSPGHRTVAVTLRDASVPARPMWNRQLEALDSVGRTIGTGVTGAQGTAVIRLLSSHRATRVVDLTDHGLVIPWASSTIRFRAAPPP